MTDWPRPSYTGIARVRGPLVVVTGAEDVGWDEFADIRVGPQGAAAGNEAVGNEAVEDDRHGLVLDTARDRVLVQVLEGTGGMRTEGMRVTFSGAPLRVPVGTAWLGRVCDGMGQPLDGGPPVLGGAGAPVAGVPLNPVHREPPAEPVLTGISAVDALTTLARGQKLPMSPSASSSPRWASPTRTPPPSGRPWRDGPRPASWCCCSTSPTPP
ncbi:hypothetical protein GCM10023178_75870 [Actinomadura luteofluorescens]